MVKFTTDNATSLLLLGDSTVRTSYLPEELQYHRALERELKALRPEIVCEVSNAADNGEFIARFLLTGAYERMRTACANPNIVVIRFGANDEKRVSPAEFEMHLDKFLDLLVEDFPGVRIFLETGVYIDPHHYSFDRNINLRPYWEKTRKVAVRRGLPLCDIYAAMERETAQGNWDLRIRKPSKGAPMVFNASEDFGRETDRQWYTNIHPNAEGVRVAAKELARCLSTVLPGGFPVGQTAVTRLTKSGEEYSSWLGFPAESLRELANPPWRAGQVTSHEIDDLQQSVQLARRAPKIPVYV